MIKIFFCKASWINAFNKKNKTSSKLASFCLFAALVSVVNVIFVYADTNTNSISKLIEKATVDMSFYYYNEAYVEIMKLNNENERSSYLTKLNSISDLVWNEDIKKINNSITELATVASGKLYDDIQNTINTANISYIDKSYLLGEVTSWGKKLVWTPDYSEGISKLSEAWNMKDLESVSKAEESILQIKNEYSRKYLLEELEKVKKLINEKSEFIFAGVFIDQAEEDVIKTLGQPTRKDLSEYGFYWYIYNKDYANYIQVGIKDGIVVAIYTNSDNWQSKAGVRIGTVKKDVEKLYGNKIDNIITRFFYDIHNEDRLTAVLLIKDSLNSIDDASNAELKLSFERQIFDLVNAIRARNGLSAYLWDDIAANTARKHSLDMSDKNYFNHTNLDGKSPFDRMKAEGINYSMASENIAAGYSNAIEAHEAWMNSLGHRNNILGNCSRLGVGVSFGGSYGSYFTENFYTPR